MHEQPAVDRDGARRVPEEEIPLLLHDVREEVLLGLFENPKFTEPHLHLLLGRKELPLVILEEIARHKDWVASYRIRKGLAFHPHVPQTLGLHLLHELHVPDLVQLALSQSSSPPLRHMAEEMVLARVPQLPPAQKILLARRGSARVAGALLADGNPETLPIVLASAFLNEGQVLKALSRITLPQKIVTAIAEHARWSSIYSIRLALIRNPQTPLARVLHFLPSISTPELRMLGEASSSVPLSIRPHIRRELANRMQHGPQRSRRSNEI